MADFVPSTFQSIDLEPQASADSLFPEFVKAMLAKMKGERDRQSSYYEKLRRQNSRWANGSRWVLALLGTIAFLLTGIAAVLRFLDDTKLAALGISGADRIVLLVVLMVYAIMGAIGFYERSTDKTTTYFRHVGIALSIRDLWTRAQFEMLKELTALKSAAADLKVQDAARERIRALTEGFCNDLNKLSASELTEWRTEFLASLSELDAAAKQGTESVTKRIEEAVKTAEKAAADAVAAAKAAEAAAQPGAVNVTVTGDFDGEVALFVDGKEKTRSVGKTLALESLQLGQRKISARAKKGDKSLEASSMIDVKPGLQDIRIALA